MEWKGKTVVRHPTFAPNPIDLLDLPQDSMASFRFYGWLVVEIFTDSGHVGIGNAALAPRLTKRDDRPVPEVAADRRRSIRLRVFKWQHHVPPDDGVRVGKGIAMVAISSGRYRHRDLMNKASGQPVFKLFEAN